MQSKVHITHDFTVSRAETDQCRLCHQSFATVATPAQAQLNQADGLTAATLSEKRGFMTTEPDDLEAMYPNIESCPGVAIPVIGVRV